jgi:putative ABC transport system substrate-binding protein
VYTDRGQVEAGMLMSVGPDYTSIFRRGAAYVDRIFTGAQPADLPVELPTTFDVAVNLKTAQTLGLEIPSEVAAQVTLWVQ